MQSQSIHGPVCAHQVNLWSISIDIFHLARTHMRAQEVDFLSLPLSLTILPTFPHLQEIDPLHNREHVRQDPRLAHLSDHPAYPPVPVRHYVSSSNKITADATLTAFPTTAPSAYSLGVCTISIFWDAVSSKHRMEQSKASWSPQSPTLSPAPSSTCVSGVNTRPTGFDGC